MNKLHSFAFYALATPVIALSAGSVLAQQPAGQNMDRHQTSTNLNRSAGQTNSQKASDHGHKRDHSHTKNRGFLNSSPANGMRAKDLIGATVSTASDDDVGSVDDLIIDENGQIVAIVVGVGGFLGMGESDVAIGWGHVTTSVTDDERELRVDVTGDNLRSAPKFVKAD